MKTTIFSCALLASSTLFVCPLAIAQSAALEAIRNNDAKLREEADAASKRDPATHFVVVAPGVVRDTRTKLEWMRCSLGQDWDDNIGTCNGEPRKYNWFSAKEIARKLNGVGGYAKRTGWRVPTIRELKSLIYCSNGLASNGDCAHGSMQPAVSQTIFPETFNGWYWSSTPNAYFTKNPEEPQFAWFVGFRWGGANDDGDTAGLSNAVRLVR